MSHMPTMGSPGTSSTSLGGTIVEYIATGAEGTNFIVPIGVTMQDDDYEIMWSPSGVQNVPFLDFPENPGDRTTTYFRVLSVAQLAAGEKLVFVLVET